MNWSDVTKTQSEKTLRQFAGLCLILFGGLGAWRFWQGHSNSAIVLMSLGLVLGAVGLAWPSLIRPVFTVWMMAAFPIGWVVSRLVLALLFYGLFTPVAILFKIIQRDELHRRRRSAASYWSKKPAPAEVKEYLRQF